MLNISNILSVSRAGLALLFLSHNTWLCLIALIGAMITDILDGFLARKYGISSHFGAILDPLMDKFFVCFVGTLFLIHHELEMKHLIMLLSRDIALFCFGIYLFLMNQWKNYECKSIFWGKATTILQFGCFIALTLKIPVPSSLYYLFLIFGINAFCELLRNAPTHAAQE